MSELRATCGAALVVALGGCGGGDEATTSTTDAPLPPDDDTQVVQSAPWFEDATEVLGLDFVHDAGVTPEKHLPETMGAGAAIGDWNGDGAVDVYFVQSGPMPVPGVDRSDAPPNRLFTGDGAGVFRDATDSSGDAAHTGYGMGVTAGDVDGDGDGDLYVTNFGPDALLLSDGRGAFTNVTSAAGLGDERWTGGASFFDGDGDGDLDLYVVGYVAIDVTDPVWCGDRRDGWRSYCHPDRYEGLADRYWRNRGDGTFEDATEAAGLADNRGKGLGVIAGDLDDDGDLDLYVANDSVENKLWRNEGDGTFYDDTLLTGTGVNRNGATEAGMGLAMGDADGDLDFDLLVTNFDDESNTLYRNDGGGLFTDATIPMGLDAESRLPVGFGCAWADFDLDGDLDLAVANGHIIDNIHLYHDGKTWRQPALLFENDGRRYKTAEAPGDLTATPFVGRGLFAGDLNGDGALDLLLTQCGGAARAFLNRRGPSDPVEIRGLAPGSSVRAKRDGAPILRRFGAATSYFGHGEDLLLLPSDAIEVEVREPGGAWRPL